MILYQKIDQILKKRYNSWKTIQSSYFESVKRESELYFGDTESTGTPFTEKQVKNIDATTALKANINEIYPIVTTLLALLTRFKPSHKVIAKHRDEMWIKFAEAIDTFKYDILYKGRANKRMKSALKDMLLTGQGIVGTEEEDFYRDGELNISLDTYHPENVIWDINCKDDTLQAQIGYFLEEEMTVDIAKKRYGGLMALLQEKFPDQNLSFEFFSRTQQSKIFKRNRVEGTEQIRTIWIRRYFEKQFATLCYVKNGENIDRTFLENAESEEEIQFITANKVDTQDDIFIREHLYFGDYEVETFLKPVTDYEHQAVFFEWGGKPYQSYSLIHFIKDNALALHSILQNLILNAYLINNAGWTAPQGAIPKGTNKKQWEDALANPMKMKIFNIVTGPDGKVLRPEKDQVTPMGQHMPFLYEMIKNGMGRSTGIDAALRGDVGEANIETFQTLQQFHTNAMERIRMIFDDVQDWSERTGNVLIQKIINALQPGMEYIFQPDPERNPEGEVATFKANPEFMRKIKLGKFKLIAIPAEGLPAEKLARGRELMNIAQSSPNEAERSEYTQAGLLMMGGTDVKRVIGRLDNIKRLEGTVAEKDKVIKRNVELLKQMENQVIDAELKLKIANREINSIETITRAEEKAKFDAIKENFVQKQNKAS